MSYDRIRNSAKLALRRYLPIEGKKLKSFVLLVEEVRLDNNEITKLIIYVEEKKRSI